MWKTNFSNRGQSLIGIIIVLVLFPIYILLASIKNQYLQQAWTFISVLLLAFYTILFVNNYWAG